MFALLNHFGFVLVATVENADEILRWKRSIPLFAEICRCDDNRQAIQSVEQHSNRHEYLRVLLNFHVTTHEHII